MELCICNLEFSQKTHKYEDPASRNKRLTPRTNTYMNTSLAAEQKINWFCVADFMGTYYVWFRAEHAYFFLWTRQRHCVICFYQHITMEFLRVLIASSPSCVKRHQLSEVSYIFLSFLWQRRS